MSLRSTAAKALERLAPETVAEVGLRDRLAVSTRPKSDHDDDLEETLVDALP